jgi:hypothetical protein
MIFSIISFAQQKNGVYDFPIKGGTPEWKALKTHDEMLNALQIPENIFKNMTTEDLAQTCLNYPLFPDIWAFDGLQYGFEQVKNGFNGLQELFKRKSAGQVLIKKYNEMDPTSFNKNWTPIEKGKFATEFSKIEIILAQNDILKNLLENDLKLLLKEALKKNNSMSLNSNIFDIKSIEPNTFLMGKILLKAQDNNFVLRILGNKNLKIFLETGSFANKNSINDIISSVKKHLGE